MLRMLNKLTLYKELQTVLTNNVVLDKKVKTQQQQNKKSNININGGDVQRKNVVNNVDKSSLWAPWQNGPYKNTQNSTKHGVNKDATDIKK